METKFKTISPIVNNGTFGLKTQKEYLIIQIGKILFCKADGSYSHINLDDGSKIIVSKPLISLERFLMSSNFIRCHNSYLINAYKVEKFSCKKGIIRQR